jgi:hypothetical protein
MSKPTVEVEGESLQDALAKAAALLGIERDAVDFEYDREHLAAGASTVRIFAYAMDAEELAKARARRAEEAARAAAPRDDRPRDDRGPRRDDRGPRRDDRGPRSDDRGPRRDDRGPRLDRGPRRDDRGPRRDDRGPRPKPEKDPVRDEEIRTQARALAERVKGGEGSLSFDDLNSYERHLVHTVVAELGGLASTSEGEGNRKNVRISLKPAE